jgi:3'-5' exonuclease
MQNIRTENLLFIDIETVSEKSTFNNLSEAWQQLWAEKTQRILPSEIKVEDFYEQRAGVMAEFAKVICISIGYFRYEGTAMQLRVKSFFDKEEKVLLQNFIATLNQMEIQNNKWCFAGHNIKEFDIPFLCRRLLINALPIPIYMDFQNMKPWETNILDTFQYWRFGDYKNYTSLKLLAAALGIASPKDDIDGSEVGGVYWKENDLQRIVNYCQKDVATVANIILKFKNLPLIENNNILIIK